MQVHRDNLPLVTAREGKGSGQLMLCREGPFKSIHLRHAIGNCHLLRWSFVKYASSQVDIGLLLYAVYNEKFASCPVL